MQSQQKRVKWSRGETAEALEERADTGITSASVELMENCIPDVYGNISRRPALKILGGVPAWFNYTEGVQVIPFYITKDDYVLFSIPVLPGTPIEFIRITNGEIVKFISITSGTETPYSGDRVNGVWKAFPISYSQSNNYMILATETNIYKITITTNGSNFTPAINFFKFSAGFYAVNGTGTIALQGISSSDPSGTWISGLNVSGQFSNYTYTNSVGDVNVYSKTSLGIATGGSVADLFVELCPLGSIIQLPNIGAYLRVTGYDASGSILEAYGELLTPVANSSATDNVIKVEYGYEDFMPRSYNSAGTYPHPTKVAFYNQRLWAGDWKLTSSLEHSFSMVIGSQIAKYNDFENNYNQENEAISLDVLTQFREKIEFLGDYNGLKIMTDTFEYAYENGAVVKQSANGSLRTCEPVVFDSLCLYVDKSGQQVKAMQYEFQANIYNSTTINQFAPHDLVWYPIKLSDYEDKVNSTGKYLFVVNKTSANNPKLAVCNFVPSNQATIWSRWSMPNISVYPTTNQISMIYDIVTVPQTSLFLLVVNSYLKTSLLPEEGQTDNCIILATLDFDGTADLETTLDSDNHVNIMFDGTSTDYRRLSLKNTEVAVYSNGEYQFITTTDNKGAVTDDISQLTNITVGLPINAIIRSHPIDVGGKTKSIKKRIGKARMSVRDTQPGAITINNKTGYMNPAQDLIDFYGVTGMKDEVKYTITNNKGAMFHLESLLMNIEYGTLDS